MKNETERKKVYVTPEMSVIEMEGQSVLNVCSQLNSDGLPSCVNVIRD